MNPRPLRAAHRHLTAATRVALAAWVAANLYRDEFAAAQAVSALAHAERRVLNLTPRMTRRERRAKAAQVLTHAQVLAAVQRRAANNSSGPRSLRQLAFAIGADPGALNNELKGLRLMPAAHAAGILRELPELASTESATPPTSV